MTRLMTGLILTGCLIASTVVCNGDRHDVLIAESLSGGLAAAPLHHLANAVYGRQEFDRGERVFKIHRGADGNYQLHWGRVEYYRYDNKGEPYRYPEGDTSWWNMGELIPAGRRDDN